MSPVPPYLGIIAATAREAALGSLDCDASNSLTQWCTYLENEGADAESETTKALIRFAFDHANSLTTGDRSALPELFGPFPVACVLSKFHASGNVAGTTAIWSFLFQMTLEALAKGDQANGNSQRNGHAHQSNPEFQSLILRLREAVQRLDGMRRQMTNESSAMDVLAKDIVRITEENERKFHAATGVGETCLVDTPEWSRVVRTAFNLCTGVSKATADAHDVQSLVGNIASCLDGSNGDEGDPFRTITSVAALVRGMALYTSLHGEAMSGNEYLKGQWESIRASIMVKFLPMATSFLPNLMSGVGMA
jgi:hypothetical protein